MEKLDNINFEVDSIDVEEIYEKSMLLINDNEKDSTVKKFKDVLRNVNTIFDVESDGVPYFEITTSINSPLRDDVPQPSLERNAVLSNTKHREYGYFKVGKVVD